MGKIDKKVNIQKSFANGKLTEEQKNNIEKIETIENTINNMVIPTKVSDLTNDSKYATEDFVTSKISGIGTGGSGSGEYAPISHTHTKSQITDFPTKLSQFTNDLPTSSGGTGATKTSALITDFGAVNNSSVTYNTSTKTYVGTDCSQAILDAIASGYTKIEFPAGGSFIVNTTIQISKKVLIEGNGANIYVNPISGSDHTVIYFKAGTDGSVIQNLNFYSTKAYTVNLNTNVTAKSSNNSAINFNNNAANIVVKNCYAKGFKYLGGCSSCKNITFEDCRGEDNYFTIYTGYNAYNTIIRRCDFASQVETDMYGHVLYLGGASYGVRVEDCYFESLGDDSSNIIKCGADQAEYCTGVVVRNTTMKCKSKASFLYCHAHADVEYYDCRMIFTNSSSAAFPRLLQFNPYSTMKFKNCKFELDSVQKITHTDSDYTSNTLIFEDCHFIVRNTVNKSLTLSLHSSAKDFKFIRTILDFSLLDRGINLISSYLYSLEMLDCIIYLPSGSMIGKSTSSSVSYTQTSPKLLMTNSTIIRTYSSTESNMLFNFVKGSSSAKISLANVVAVNGQNSSGNYAISTSSSEYNAFHNVVNISDSGVSGTIDSGSGNLPSGGNTGGGSSSGGESTTEGNYLLAELGTVNTSGAEESSTTRARTNYLPFTMKDSVTINVPTGYCVVPRFYNSSKQFITPATLIATNNDSYWGITPDTSFNGGWISANCTLLKAQNASDTVAYVIFIFKY